MASDSTSPIAGDTTPHPRRRSADVAFRYRTLDGIVAAASQTDGIELIDVDAFTTLVVRTDNSVYRIAILTPHLGEVLVQGGKFFPERTRACLSGSTFGGSCLKMGWVGLGLHLEFHVGGQWIITSHVRAIAVEPSPTGAPCYRISPASARARCEAPGPASHPWRPSGTTDPLTMRTCALYGQFCSPAGAVERFGVE